MTHEEIGRWEGTELSVYKPLVALKKGGQREEREGGKAESYPFKKGKTGAEEMPSGYGHGLFLWRSRVPLTRRVAHDQPHLQLWEHPKPLASMGTHAHSHTLAYIFSHIYTLTYIVSHTYPLLAYSHTHIHTLLNSHTLTHILSHLHIHNLK